MSLYRGPGGSGDATNDANSQAILARAAASAAEVSKNQAQASAAEASNSASSASTSATNAASSATTATTQATNASNSASAASTSATNAASSASSASTSATNAASSATAASGSATSASSSASSASTSATNAASSATSAANAQTAAESARDATLAAYDSFDDRYLGAKIADPVLDNDGNALQAGELYFNSISGVMKVYTGTIWVDAYAAGDSFLAKANNLSDLPSVSTARTNLGLGTAAVVADNTLVHLAGTETITGDKTFSTLITGSISGNAGTVTNGVYTTGSYADPAWITTLAGSKINGTIDGGSF